MPEDLVEFNNIITLRNHLCRFTEKQLLDIYQDPGAYVTFLDAVALLADVDSAFLLFSDVFLEKILSVIQIHRFNFEEKEISECVNGIIAYINDIKTYPDNLKNSLKNGYLTYQEEVRETKFHSTEELLASLAYDAYVFACLRDGKENQIVDDKYYLLSLNFLMKSVPEFFKDPEVAARAMSVLDRVGKDAKMLSPRKKHVKKVRENFINIVNSEE